MNHNCDVEIQGLYEIVVSYQAECSAIGSQPPLLELQDRCPEAALFGFFLFEVVALELLELVVLVFSWCWIHPGFSVTEHCLSLSNS